MRFLHTSDWQLGMKASHVEAAATRIREERINTARKLLDVIRDNDIEFLIVAGDTFENNAVERVLVQTVADIMASFGVPVFVIPGNHDPLIPGSVWEHPSWKSAKSVHVLHNEEPIEVPGGFLYPCPVYEKHSGKNPTAWINNDNEGAIRIGMAHGTVEGIPVDEPDYPIPRDAATRSGLNYLALGHWHSMATYATPDGDIRMAYSGTHETTKFGERDSGNVLIVEIPDAEAMPIVRPVKVGQLEWKSRSADLRQPGDLTQLLREIELMENPTSQLLDLQVTGILSANEYEEIHRIQEIVSSRFIYGRVDVSRIRPSPQDESWLANLPTGIIREAGELLQQMAEPSFEGERSKGATTEVASRALMELYAIVTEVTS